MYAVLCIDDHNTTLSELSFLVRSCGFICLTAPTAEEAVSAFEQSRVNMVVLDHDLSSSSAVALAKSLKQVRDVPIILLSGKTMEEKPHNVDLVIPKPIEARVFSKMLQWVARGSRSVA
ncbi:MAG TPA: response regulator [Terriglobales bacterium]